VSESDITVEPVEIPKGEKADLLDLVEEYQQVRATKRLPAEQIPSILLPYQIKWHQDTARVRLAEKSRRIGFSWGCIAAEGTLEAAAQRGMNQYYMGYNMGMAAENIGDARTFAEAYGMVISAIDVSREREVIGEKKQDITRFRLTFSSGYIYEALSSSPWNWRGRQGHAWIDEAAFHRNLQEVIKGAMAFLMWGGRVDIISTHNSEENDFFELCRQVKTGKVPYSLHHIDFDQAIAEGLYKRICLVTGKDWSPEAERAWRNEQFASYPDQADANEELLCIAKKGSGAYFTRMLIEQCQIKGVPVIRWSKPAEWVTCETRIEEAKLWIKDVLQPVLDNMTDDPTAYGQDFGRDGDLSNIWLMQKRDPTRWKMAVMIDLRSIPFDVQAFIRDHILDAIKPKLHHASFDARGNGQSHAEAALQKIGALRVSCIKATAQFYDEWFPKYKQAYEDRSFLVADCEDIITDHRRVVLVRGRPTMDDGRDKGEDGLLRHGDSAIGGLMSYHATCQAPNSIIEYNPMPAKRDRYDGKRNDVLAAVDGAW
jgi:phage FluMu gp28-like protein